MWGEDQLSLMYNQPFQYYKYTTKTLFIHNGHSDLHGLYSDFYGLILKKVVFLFLAKFIPYLSSEHILNMFSLVNSWKISTLRKKTDS